ncbi:MAG: type II toxin-antitoxin system HicA family toxin [Candidatus Marsarchaeota archaeon]|nr:type II toxin-antitoxin system HicA family toxin [Candidatus Marsarchaeota archaeon]
MRQKGSHVFLTDGVRYTTVPYHNSELKPGILNKILDDVGLTKDDIKKYI